MSKMNFKERMEIYYHHPKCIINDIKFEVRRNKEKFWFFLRKKLIADILSSDKCIYKYEIGNTFNSAILFPCSVVSMVLAEHFKRLDWLGIHGIDVNTQNEEGVFITISLSRPGLLIGKSGKDINAIQNRLTEVFGRNTSISLQEVNDMNKNMVYIQSEGF